MEKPLRWTLATAVCCCAAWLAQAAPPDNDSATVSDEQWLDSQEPPAEPRPAVGAPAGAGSSRRNASLKNNGPVQRLVDQRSGVAVVRPTPTESKQLQPVTPSRIEIAPAQFNGAQPATTTRDELIANWGEPAETRNTKAGPELRFDLEPFERIVVSFVDDVVDTIVISLMQPIEADRLAQELKLQDLDPVIVRDQRGRPIGEAYPERGVVFSFVNNPKGREAKQILLAPIDLEAFVLRAQANLHRRYELSLNDLDFVIEQEPTHAQAHWLRAELLLDLARYPQALHDAEQAVALDGTSPRYEVTLSAALNQVGQADAAQSHAEKALRLAQEGTVEKALALVNLADCHNYAAQQDYEGAVSLAQQALKIANPLATDQRFEARELARRVLLQAHLSIARDIAWGAWKRKATAVPMWLEKAEAIARDTQERPEGRGDEMFLVAREALTAYVGMQGEVDPKHWADIAAKEGSRIIRETDDPLLKSRTEWELGLAMYDALQICHMRRAFEPALQYGKLAVRYLEQAGSERAAQPGHAYMMGRLYFRIGSIHAVQFKNHEKAMPWFEKAVPLLEEPIPDSSMADIGRQGETFVSVAVSYWASGRRSEAVSLTKEGLRLMDQAVDEGLLERSALLVPYANLAQMHELLGDDEEAKRYQEMAASLKATTKR